MKFCVECGTKLILKESINCGVSDGLIPYCNGKGNFVKWYDKSDAPKEILQNSLAQYFLLKSLEKIST